MIRLSREKMQKEWTAKGTENGISCPFGRPKESHEI
jgi:hypothetical protein